MCGLLVSYVWLYPILCVKSGGGDSVPWSWLFLIIRWSRKFPRSPNNQEQPQAGNRYTQKTHHNEHKNQLQFQPPHRAQNCCIPTLLHENAIPSANNRKTKKRMEENKNYSSKQQFPDKVITQLKSQTKKNTQNTGKRNKHKQKQKKTVFTYHSPRIWKLTNLFKHTDIDIAFRSTNTIQHLTKPKPQNHTQEHNKCWI